MGVRDEALGVTPGRTASSADLGGSKFYIFFCLREVPMLTAISR